MVPTDELADRQTQIQRALRAWHEVLDDPSSYLDHWWLVRSRLTANHEPLTASHRRRLSNDLLTEGLAELEQIDPIGARILRDRFVLEKLGKEVAQDLDLSLDQMNRQQAAALRRLTDLLIGREQAALAVNARRLEEGLPPAPYRTLFGFEELTDRVAGLLQSLRSADAVILTGLGGQGKTSLALATARRLAHIAAFDEMIWLRVPGEGGHDRLPFDFSAVVGRLSEVALGGDAPGDPAARLAQLRQAMKRRSYLVIIDNLERPDELAALLSDVPTLAGPSRFLLTSRLRPEPGVPSQVVALGELNRDDSLSLVFEQVESTDTAGPAQLNDADAEAMYTIVGGNPLALRLAAALSAVQPLEGLLRDLRERRTRSVDDLYRHIYWRLWQALSQNAQALLIAMPLVAEMGADTEQLAAISGLSDKELWPAIHELWGRSLLETRGTARDRRYGIHRLTETFVQTDLTGWRGQPDA